MVDIMKFYTGIQPNNIPYGYGKIVKIGKNVIIGTGTVLGCNGFGYERVNGKLVHKEHEFGVIIEDDVVIHPLCVIEKGRHRDTVIKSGTRIDSFTHIGHNVIVGNDCLIGSSVKILGSCEIGDGSEIWSGAVINQGVKIGKGCTIGAQSYVRHDVKDGQKVFGVPAKKRI